MNPKIPINELLWSADAAKIFGISRTEFYRRIKNGKIKGVRAVLMLKGRMYSIYDCMKLAHPKADKKTIEELVYKFRQDLFKSKRRGK